MTLGDKAQIFLNQMDEHVGVDWELEDKYITAFVEGLKEIEEIESKEN